MHAYVYHQYGMPDVLRRETLEKPSPVATEVLIKIMATSVNTGDWYTLRGKPAVIRLEPGAFSSPKHPVLGMDVAGVVEAVGADVTAFSVGDAVVGNTYEQGFGTFAEYVAVPADVLTLKPENVSFEQAASLPTAAATALQGLRDHGNIQAGQHVLIYGASGGVGTFAVQIAQAYGCEVTAVCSTRHIDTLRALGVAHIIDYTQDDFLAVERSYDVILAVNGYRGLGEYKKALKPNGVCVVAGGKLKQIFQNLLLGWAYGLGSSKKFKGFMHKHKADDVATLLGMIAEGKLAPVIDKTFTFEDLPDAVRAFGDGGVHGKVVVAMASA